MAVLTKCTRICRKPEQVQAEDLWRGRKVVQQQEALDLLGVRPKQDNVEC